MLAASGAEAEVAIDGLPLYDGAAALARDGESSSMLPENLALAGLLRGDVEPSMRAVLFDPQTAGGLLAGIPAEQAETCVAALRAAGHTHAAVIGRVSRTGLPTSEVGVAIVRTSGARPHQAA